MKCLLIILAALSLCTGVAVAQTGGTLPEQHVINAKQALTVPL